ncbi:hypothetical protein [Uliginosibacterium gangwonense]|uniref:hypothetical protein n=1 Tax=Uliginosibacterium gangwonense TaxID=392736 RepID=UPI0003653E3C|nr:hypothetical protein [Uliginosibacterium gangwonense]
MYIVAIAWLFVVLVLSISQNSILAGVLTLFFWGILPLGLLLWIVGTPSRRLRKTREEAAQEAKNNDQQD